MNTVDKLYRDMVDKEEDEEPQGPYLNNYMSTKDSGNIQET